MRAWDIVRTRLRSLLLRGRRESDLHEELQFHLEQETERLQATGLPYAEARLQARRLFGGVEQIKEESRDARGIAAVEALARDAHYGIRRLVRDWRFTAAAVLILGLAIGINTAIFSAVNAVLFRPEAVARPEQLVNIYQNDRGGNPEFVISYSAYQSIAEYTDVFAATMASSIPNEVRYLHEGAVRNAVVEYATASYLDTLGLQPALGRWFDRTEEQRGAALVGLIGHQAWTSVFHADPSVIGQIVRIEGAPVTIIGVAPRNHRGTIDIGLGTDFWLPITALPRIAPSRAQRDTPTIFAPLLVKGRLRDGMSLPQARAAMDGLSRRLEAENPEQYRRASEFALGPGITVVPSMNVRIHPQADRAVMGLASGLLILVGLVLAIACSNLATLLLVRSAARAKEVSIRLAMGAKRSQLFRTLLTESVVLALAGGVAGCLIAWWTMRALPGVSLPFRVDLTLDYRVLSFAIALSFITGIVFGLAPALRATRVDPLQTLRDEGVPPLDHRRLTLKNALIVVQVAISVLLLGGTSMFLQQAAAVRAHRPGFAVDGVAMLETDLRFAGYSEAESSGVYEELRRRVAATPGVESAALLRGLPMRPNGVAIVVDGLDGQPATEVAAVVLSAGPAFFDTLRIPLLFGRVFDARDRAETPRVAVITGRMARMHFGAVNAVGRRFRLANDPDSWMEVIGVVRDTGTGDFTDDVIDRLAPAFYTSYTLTGAAPTTVVARTSGDAGPLVAAMERELRALDITLPVITARTMAQALADAQVVPSMGAWLLGALGGLGLLLASIGLYAVVAFAVARRTREIGIRMALGARNQQVVWTIARGVAGLITVGTGVGLGLSVLVIVALRSASGDIGVGSIAIFRPAIEPLALLSIAAVTAAVGIVATFVPGRRAARMDPLRALRHD